MSEGVAERTGQRRIGNVRRVLEVLETLALTAVIFFVIQNFVAQPYKVEQQSMQRTLEAGEYVLVDKLTPRFDSYSRGDVVVFHPLGSSDAVPYIKRVIALPGETVEIHDGRVFVNGRQLDEPYVFDDQPTETSGDERRFVVEPGHLFVLGDHRGESRDSRFFGTIPDSSVIGRAWIRYWPIDTLGILPTPSYRQ